MPNYLYNGVELPQLPDWDKVTCPYAYMLAQYLVVSSVPALRFAENGLDYCRCGNGVNSSVTNARYKVNSDEWVIAKEMSTNLGIEVGVNQEPCFWCNYDIVDSEDSSIVYLAASEPVPVGGEPTLPEGDFYRVINGAWVKCDAVRPMDQASGEPVAYQYNDVQFPDDINTVWTDKETYPYAYITYYLTSYRLYLCKTPIYFENLGEGQGWGLCVPNGSLWYGHNNGYWEYFKTVETETGHQYNNHSVGSFIWCSSDILREGDGKVMFTASEPVPVYSKSSAWVKQDEYIY